MSPAASSAAHPLLQAGCWPSACCCVVLQDDAGPGLEEPASSLQLAQLRLQEQLDARACARLCWLQMEGPYRLCRLGPYIVVINYQSSVTLVKPTPRLLHSLLSALGFRPWEEGAFSRRGAQPRYRCAESAASPGGFSSLSTGTAEGQGGAASCPARGGGVASSVFPSASADLSLGGLAEPGRQVVDTTRSSVAGTPPAALGSAVAAPTRGGAHGV